MPTASSGRTHWQGEGEGEDEEDGLLLMHGPPPPLQVGRLTGQSAAGVWTRAQPSRPGDCHKRQETAAGGRAGSGVRRT